MSPLTPVPPPVLPVTRSGSSWGTRFLAWLRGIGYTALALILVVFITVVMVLRFYGLPQGVKNYLLLELENRGVVVSVDKLRLDPTGGIVAERVSVFHNASREELWLQVDRVRLGIAWLSWWRGQPFLQSATVANAQINLPLTDKTTVTLRQVNASVQLGTGQITVRRAEARLLNLALVLQGHMQLNGSKPGPPRTAEQNAKLDAIWQKVLSFSDDFETENPIRLQVNFEAAAATPLLAKVQAVLDSKSVRWRGALIDQVSAEVTMSEQIVTLTEFRVQLARGEISVTGEASLSEKTGHAEFYSNLDFTPLASAFSGQAGDALSRLSFTELPVLSGRGRVNWSDSTPQVNVQADVDWRGFSYGQTEVERLTIPLAYDGQKFFIPQAELMTKSGNVSAEFYWDRAQPFVRGKLASTLDFTILRGIFGAGADNFLNSLAFKKTGPTLQVTISGDKLEPRNWMVSGHVDATDFTYKKVALSQMTSDFTFHDSEVDLPNLNVRREEGSVTGGVRENFARRFVRLTDLTAQVNGHEVATILGDKFVSYVRPYVFDRPPSLTISGLVDLNDKKEKLDTDLQIGIRGETTLSYVLLGKTFQIKNPVGTVSILDRDLTVKIERGELFKGALSGQYLSDLRSPSPHYQAAFTLQKADFKEGMIALYKNDKSSGVVTLDLKVAGTLGEVGTMTGDGAIAVEDGYLMTIPFMGGLTNLLNGIVPNFAFSKADRAQATFAIREGAIFTRDLTMTSAIFTIIGNGDYNFVKDDLNFDVRVNVRGIVGLLLFTVSKLFEYHGSGSLKETKWGPKILSG